MSLVHIEFLGGCTSILVGGVGGVDLVSSLNSKFGARSSQDHQIRGKLRKCWYHKRQNLGYLSPIFLEANFGAKPHQPPNMEVPPLKLNLPH